MLSRRHAAAADISATADQALSAAQTEVKAAVDYAVEKDRLSSARRAPADTVLHQAYHLLQVRGNRGEISRYAESHLVRLICC